MLLPLVVVLIAVLMFASTRLARRGNAKDLGWMSTRWLAQHRASHPY